MDTSTADDALDLAQHWISLWRQQGAQRTFSLRWFGQTATVCLLEGLEVKGTVSDSTVRGALIAAGEVCERMILPRPAPAPAVDLDACYAGAEWAPNPFDREEITGQIATVKPSGRRERKSA